MNTAVAVVDDNPVALGLMRRLLLQAGIESVHCFADPLRALDELAALQVAAVVVDYRMPLLNGLDFLQRYSAAKDAGDRVPMVLVTGLQDLDGVRLAALQAGAVDVMAKPLTALFGLKIRNWVQRRATTAPVHDQCFQPLSVPRDGARRTAPPAPGASVLRLLQRLAALRGTDSGQQPARMARYAVSLAEALGLGAEQQALLLQAAPLHDIGMVCVSADRQHAPTAQRDDGLTPMQCHTLVGNALLQDAAEPVLQLGAEIALHHHEQWDGQGYPKGLRGAQIPLSARIVAVAVAFDAMTSVWPGGAAGLVDRACAVINADAGHQFDPQVVNAFNRVQARLLQIQAEFDDGPPPARLKALDGLSAA